MSMTTKQHDGTASPHDVLARRAQKFSRASVERAAEDRHEVVTFAFNGNQYAVPLSQLAEIRRLEHHTPIPQAAAHVAGVTNIRNRIVAIYMLSESIQSEITEQSSAQDNGQTDGQPKAYQAERFILVGHGKAADVALLADEIVGTDSIELSDAGQTPVSLAHRPFISGVDSSGRIYLDLGKLVDDKTFYNA